MIYTDSRYAGSYFTRSYDAKRDNHFNTVVRKFPEVLANFDLYEWEEGDRIDVVASKFSGKPRYWEQIMDVNPEISNPFTIAPGTSIRIPKSFKVVG